MDKPEEIAQELISFLSDLNIPKQAVVKVDCYALIKSNDDHASCSSTYRSALTAVFKDQIPAHTFIAQQPIEKDNEILFRIGINDVSSTKVEYKEFQKHNYCVLSNYEERILISGAIGFESAGDALRDIQTTFDFAEQLLDHEEMHFGHMAVLNNYLANIDNSKKDVQTGWTNTQTLKEVQGLYFDPVLFKHGYPLQTISGIDYGAFTLDFIAASKDGFATAQYNLGADAQTENEIMCYLPGLNKVFIANINKDRELTIQEQLKTSIERLSLLMSNSRLKYKESFSEIKVLISEASDLSTVTSMLNTAIKADKISVLRSHFANKQNKIEVEAIATINN